MKPSLILLMAALLATNAIAQKPDFSELNKTTARFLAVLDTLQKDLPTVNNAEGTAKAMDSFTNAMNDFNTAMVAFAEKYPEATKGAKPPPEFANAYTALSQLKTTYASVPKLMGGLAQRFRTSPEVANSMTRLRAALERINRDSSSH